jgi:hypothetical protein
MVRSQLFINYYIITYADKTIDKKLLTQNFWYSITQLVLKKNPKTKHLSSDCLESWDSFAARHNVTYEMLPKVNGYSNYITTACLEMATTYTNNVVECFESRLKAYIFQVVAIMFEKAHT